MLRRARVAVSAGVLFAALSCARQPRPGRAPQDDAHADGGAIFVRIDRGQEQAPRDVLTGAWSLTAEPGIGRSPAPLHLALDIDSATGSGLHGRLVHVLVGNVGLDPARFGPITGTIATDSAVSITVATIGSGSPGVTLKGKLSAVDTIRIARLEIGSASFGNGDGGWLLIRQ